MLRSVRFVLASLLPLVVPLSIGLAAEPPEPDESKPNATPSPQASQDAALDADAGADVAPPDVEAEAEPPPADESQPAPPPPSEATQAQPSAPSSAPAKDPGPEDAAARRRIEVHIETDADDVALRRLRGRFGRVVCTAPCDQTIEFDQGDWFILEGDFMPTPRFQLDEAKTEATIVLDAGSEAVNTVGFVTMAVGLTGIVVSGAVGLLMVFDLGEPEPGTNGGASAAEEDDYPYGPVFGPMAGGAALAVIGIILFATTESDLEIVPGPGGIPQVAFRF